MQDAANQCCSNYKILIKLAPEMYIGCPAAAAAGGIGVGAAPAGVGAGAAPAGARAGAVTEIHF